MSLLRSLVLLSLTSTMIWSCYSDRDDSETFEVPDPPKLEIEGHNTFLATAVSGKLVEGVRATLSDQSTSSSINGFGSFQTAFNQLDGRGISYSKQGYFSQSFSLPTFSGSTHMSILPLINVSHAQKNSPDQPGHFEVINSFSIEVNGQLFEANSTMIYDEEYIIQGKILNTKEHTFFHKHRTESLFRDASGIQLIAPSMTLMTGLKTISNDDLWTNGEMNFKIEDLAIAGDEFIFYQNEAGWFEKAAFQLSDQTVEFSVPNTRLILVGRLYHAQNHELQITDANFIPLSNYSLNISSGNGIQFKSYRTDGEGKIRLWASDNTIEVTANDLCGNAILSDQVTLTNKSETVVIEPEPTTSLLVRGSVINCDGSYPVGGHILGKNKTSNWVLPLTENGRFNAYLPLCNNLSISAEFYNNSRTEPIREFSITPSDQFINLNIQACEHTDLSEANILIGNNNIRFDECAGIIQGITGQKEKIQLSLSTPSSQEVHVFEKQNNSTNGIWFSRSAIIDGQYQILSIGSTPSITSFDIQGQDYMEIRFENVLFQDISSGQKARGTMQYLIKE